MWSAAQQEGIARGHAEAERELRAHGMFGDGAVFDRSKVSKELLIDLHEFVENWMPGTRHTDNSGLQAVRSGIFVRAVEILEGQHEKGKSLAAAIAWIQSIDLRTFDVRQLYGVGPKYEADWKELMADPEFAATVRPPIAAKS